MKKIPTLFQREFFDDHSYITKPVVTPGFEWVIEGNGLATIKFDGACCAIIDGILYKRYDAKHGKPVPDGAIKCQEEADPITGHLPCWVKCDRFNPADKWFWSAFDNLVSSLPRYPEDVKTLDGTYEAIGLHFQGNPYHLKDDRLIEHGKSIVEIDRSFEGIQRELQRRADEGGGVEGFVFWKDGEPKCKIKSSDFGINWKGSHTNDTLLKQK